MSTLWEGETLASESRFSVGILLFCRKNMLLVLKKLENIPVVKKMLEFYV